MNHIPKCFRFTLMAKTIYFVAIILFFLLIGGVSIADELDIGLVQLLWMIFLNENNVIAFTILHYVAYTIGLIISSLIYYESKVLKLLNKTKTSYMNQCNLKCH